MRFAVLADSHVGRGRDDRWLKEALRVAERFGVDAILVAGDLTDGLGPEQAARYRRIMERVTLPLLEVPGNHDITFRPTPSRMERFDRLMEAPRLPHALTVRGRHFVGFNSQLFSRRRRPLPGPNDPGRVHLRELEELLASLPPGPIFLLHHIPSVPNFVKLEARSTWQPEFLAGYGELLRRFPVEAVFAGHFHRDELHFVSGVPLLVCPPVSAKYSIAPSVRIVTHDRRGLRFRQLYLGPRGRGRSYQRDLRGYDEQAFRREVLGMSDLELRHLWMRRYTRKALARRPLRRLSLDLLRQVILFDPTRNPDAPPPGQSGAPTDLHDELPEDISSDSFEDYLDLPPEDPAPAEKAPAP